MQHNAMVPVGYAANKTFKVQLLHGVVLQSQLVQVPAGGQSGASVAFVGPCGQPRVARVPDGVKPGGAFPVQVPVPQPVPVVAFDAATPGDEVMFVAPDGRPRKARVPEGISGGQTFMALVEPMPVAPIEPLAPSDLEPWIKAARDFKMNTDFEVPSAELLDKLDFPGLMGAMKTESAGKLTIQALSDKIVLSRMLDNLAMPQMPMLLAIQDAALISEEVHRFVGDNSCHNDGQEFIVKPTHLSNAEGVTTVSSVSEEEKPNMTEFLESHLQTFMNKKAQEFESEALQSLSPGFVVQPKYKSCVGFPAPLEIRIVALWGKARMGVWWWGAPYTGTASQRNAWIVRKPAKRGELSEEDTWEVAHEHQGHNPGFEKALALFMQSMPQMASAAERLATAVGAPFLRVDFFVGDAKWGVRLNEVAYGSGTLHKRPSLNGGLMLVDDSHSMAQILREGMAECQSKQPAAEFLTPLGVKGSTYADVTVGRASSEHCLRLPSDIFQPASGSESEESVVPPELCHTPRVHWMPPGFAPCSDVPIGERVQPPVTKDARVARPARAVRGESRTTWKSMLDRFVGSAPSWFGIEEAGQKRAPLRRNTEKTKASQNQQGTTAETRRQQSWRGA
jgi:hypothetical protein